MKLSSFSHAGQTSWGVVTDDGIVDVGALSGNQWPTLRDALAADALSQVKELVRNATPTLQLADVTFEPVIPNPPKILCIGVAYHEHRLETGRDVTAKPMVFGRFANSQVGHEQALLRPPESEQLDFEGEVAVVIGKRGRRISVEDAWDHIAGYSVYCDATIRDWQRHTQQWTPGKNFVGTGGVGPWMVTRDEIADGTDLTLSTRLNGVEVQRTTTDLLIFSIPEMIAYCSTFTELEPGDVIATGTPGGVGGKRNPPLWMKDGDVLEVEVSCVGVLRHPVRNEAA
ncbi:5-oxopent-3-ene-1,2,5-tricarboxylate decarboxylase [Caballeronia hypogeia]|uniref:5-oxopent-3-ene-1,2,5-tricarboxylate decarboxylase n=1 Tax=Caballeronia hypogeia TaxID=1777140 RepID=A0A158CVT3_9BURK|nr:fumarylacetoacetate hydrolase family protein [Caballeronia hypogeia]SAK86438.1 5-oxopent-3-ene-1,2,5-tricarboxylate decarboxylase [Caballeronia hypogeia]